MSKIEESQEYIELEGGYRIVSDQTEKRGFSNSIRKTQFCVLIYQDAMIFVWTS